jgi:hypothetical protein
MENHFWRAPLLKTKKQEMNFERVLKRTNKEEEELMSAFTGKVESVDL